MKSSVKNWSDAKFKGWIISLLRRGTMKFPPRNEALRAAKTEKKINEKTGRIAQHYRCAGCKEEFPAKGVQVNHIQPVVGDSGFIDWNTYIERMFCPVEKLNVLCSSCHDGATQQEKEKRLGVKDKIDKSTNQCYRDMKRRCYNPNSQRYYTHGARGIKVCGRWLESYEYFLEDMGYKPEGYTLDRIDNDGDYEKSNCKWSTPKEQALNRRTNIYITYQEDTLTISQWAEVVGISWDAMKKRITTMPLERALSKDRYEHQTISDEIKEEILEKYFRGKPKITQKALGLEYGVTQSVISHWVKQTKSERIENVE